MKKLQCHKNTHWKTQFSQRFWPPGVRFRDKMGPKIAPRRGLGGSRERPGGLSEPSWPSWALLEQSWGQLGPSWSPLGAILGPLGALLEPAWALLEPPWSHLGPSWSPLGAIFGRLGDILGPLGASGAQKREILKIIEKNYRIFNIFALRSPVQGSKIGASQFHTASRRLQRAKTTCKTPPRRATIAPEASRMPQDAPKTVPETPKTLPDGTREAKNVEKPIVFL